MAEQCHELVQPWFEGVKLDLRPGYVLVIYTDDGPTGICGQCMSITCPHTYIHWFPNEEAYRAYVAAGNKIGRKGSKAKERVVVIGEWEAPGRTRVIVHEDTANGE